MLRNETNYLKAFVIFVVALITTPLLFVVRNIFSENSSYLTTILQEGILIDYIFNTIELILKVGILSSIIGFSFAYIISFYDFPLKKVFKILLTLPLSIPVYVGAYTYSGIYFSIPWLETILKNGFTMNGSVFIYTIFLYPYVYLASRSYLKNNMAHFIEASNTLGHSKTSTFWKIIVPVSRPIIVGSVLFVIFETLSDFAVVNYYGVQTLSKAISDSWLGIGQIQTASKIAMVLLFVLALLIYTERLTRGHKRYSSNVRKPLVPTTYSFKQAILFYIPMVIVLLLALVLPVHKMIKYAISKSDYIERLDIVAITLNTLFTMSVVILVILFIATVYSSILNNIKIRFKKMFHTVGVVGYSIPSLILGIGAYVLYINLDQFLYRMFSGIGLDFYIFTQTRILLVIVLVIKFMSVANANFSGNLNKYDQNLFEASSTLGHNQRSTIKNINLPLLLKSYKYVILILFIDLIKELTLTYSLRPFNFKTLSTEVYRYAGNESIEIAAYPSLVIVGISMIFIILLERGTKHVGNKRRILWLYRRPRNQ